MLDENTITFSKQDCLKKYDKSVNGNSYIINYIHSALLKQCFLISCTLFTIIRKCSEDITVCIPVEHYCDRVIDCPDGSDEAGCSCEDWNMYKCSIGETDREGFERYPKNDQVKYEMV